mmetsp:Transcript_426/g.600  ORF Transcript_426/g.600 Transcript_426/m.600 type:complete len:111 (-) Transcript_426:2107-2439(-)
MIRQGIQSALRATDAANRPMQALARPLARNFRTSQALGNQFTVYIDGKPVTVDGTYTIYQACQAAGVEVPRFCYHERLSVAGNCRMCLVEVEGTPKPVSCSPSLPFEPLC